MWEGLAQAGVRFVILGGVAMRAHGSAHVTLDLDICYDTAPDNIEKLVRILRAWNARLRLEYVDGERQPGALDARTFRDSPVLTLQTDLGKLDMMDRVAGVGDYHAAVLASALQPFGSVELRILALDALIAAKRATGRKRDQEHLIELEAIRALKHLQPKTPPTRPRRASPATRPTAPR